MTLRGGRRRASASSAAFTARRALVLLLALLAGVWGCSPVRETRVERDGMIIYEEPGALEPAEAAPSAPEVEVGTVLDAHWRTWCAILADGQVRCWVMGADDWGESSLAELPVFGPGAEARSIHQGPIELCVASADGSAGCWLRDLETTAPPFEGFEPERDERPIETASLVSSLFQACALDLDAKIHCWPHDRWLFAIEAAAAQGKPWPGELTDYWAPDGKFTMIATSGGRAHVCGLTTRGRVECWGDDRLNTPSHRYRHVAVGDTRGGTAFVCAVRESGPVDCWGHLVPDHDLDVGEFARTGTLPRENLAERTYDRDYIDVAMAKEYLCLLEDDGQITCLWIPDGRGTTPPPSFAAEGNYTDIEVGLYHTGDSDDPNSTRNTGHAVCAVTPDGHIDCWAIETEAPLPIPDDIEPILTPAASH